MFLVHVNVILTYITEVQSIETDTKGRHSSSCVYLCVCVCLSSLGCVVGYFYVR